VSRKWREVWTRYPDLCFDGTTDESTDEDTVKIKGAKFIETVNSVIRQHTVLCSTSSASGATFRTTA
jgi:hypothetical protein